MSDESMGPDEVEVDEAERPARWFRVPRKRRRWPWVFMWAALLVVGAGAGLAVASYQLLGTTLEKDGVKVVVDPKSGLYLAGTVVDFTDGLNGKGFTFNNPKATRTCGCGSSFSA